MPLRLRRAQANAYADHDGTPKEELFLFFQLEIPVPVPVYAGADHCYAKIDGLEARTAANIPYDTGSEDSVKDMLDDLADGRVKTVNGEEADAEGNVQLDVVPYADDLRTEDSVQIDAPFVVRTAGGAASIKTGDAQIRKLKGNSVHTGYVAEILEMDTELMEGSQITVALDPDVFRAYVQASAVIAMIYSTDWKIGAETVDPADYGITVTGTPEAGDMITITYVPEERGTITPADPEELHSPFGRLCMIVLRSITLSSYSSKAPVGPLSQSLQQQMIYVFVLFPPVIRI